MYGALILALAVMAAGLIVARQRPVWGMRAAGVGLLAALVFGFLHVRASRRPPTPVLGHWADDVVAARLADVILRDVPEGQPVLILHWRGDADSRRVAALERRLAGAGRAVLKYAPPAAVPTGRSNEVLRVPMEEAGVPPYYIVDAYQRHPESRAVIVLLWLCEPIAPAMLTGLPPLYFDEHTESCVPWRSLIPAGRVGAVVLRKPAASWSAAAAVKAGPEGAFDLRFQLVTKDNAGDEP